MIGYVLLIVFALIMGTIVYNVVKTYVPKNVIECPESVSIFINEVYTEDLQLNITLTNNGLFNLAGYFIRATNSSNQEIATKDLSEFLVEENARELNNIVIFNGEGNPMKPNDKLTQLFNLDEEIYSIEIIPVRFQEENKKDTFVSCGGSKIREVVRIGSSDCIPVCAGKVCGDNGCGGSCGSCGGTDVCNETGQCVPPAECTDTCESVGYECDTHTICGVQENCGDCLSNEICNATWQCELSCENGKLNTGEECDDGGIVNGDGCSSTCSIETGWLCNDEEPSNCYQCVVDGSCNIEGGEGCLCSDCEGQKGPCDEGFACDEDGNCIETDNIDSCKSICNYWGFNPLISGCVNNCGGSCYGTCIPDGTPSDYCSSPTSYCCCVS